MSEKKTRIPKRLSTTFLAVISAAVIVIVLGYEVFSRNPASGPAVTEYQKERDTRGSENAADTKRADLGIFGTDSSEGVRNNLSKVVLNVQGLSCSSCIVEIKSALAPIGGIQQVIVDISGNTAQVYYDARQVEDVQQMAEAVTGRGYPATVLKTYSPEEIRRQEEIAAARAQSYIASVGGWDISRSDFNIELAHARKRYEDVYGNEVLAGARGQALMDSLRAQIASRLVDEGVMMQEITRAEFTLPSGTVEGELDRIIRQSNQDREAFEGSLKENGITYDYFRKRLETKLLIGHYMDQVVFRDASTDADHQRLFTAWFNNAKLLSEIVYYDRELERLVQEQSARGTCGG